MSTLAQHRSALSMIWPRTLVELKMFFRERDMMIFIFGFPIMFFALFASIFTGSFDGTDIPIKIYFLPAMIAAGVINTGFQALAISLAVDRDDGVLKRLRGTPLPPLAFFGGVVVRVYIVAIIQTAILLILAATLYGLELPSDSGSWIRFAWIFTLGTATSTALGIGFSSLPRSGKSASAVVTPIVLVLQFISGVYFQFSQLPTFLQQFAEIFPLKWIAQGMRSVFLPDEFASNEMRGTWELGTIAIVVGIWLVVGLALAIKSFRWQPVGDK